MQVVNIRGTTSSGKTTLVRQLIEASKEHHIIALTNTVRAHLLDNKIIIGTYKKGGKFGGVDGIKRIVYVEPAIIKALEIKPMVVFEGLLVSHSYERWRDFSERIREMQVLNGVKDNGLIWTFVLPTFRTNLNQLRKRNEIVGSVREVRGGAFIMNFIQRYKSMQRIKKRAVADGEVVHILPKEDSFDALQEILASIHEPKLLPKTKSGIRALLK